ncbi:MAG: M20/M25/M40 family metallo-hydrolase [Hyphomonadaceae bacterium]|nr:M20/M25/M40 family metallo-hydrolase [Hyphomonadaceae bacterium]
MVRVILAAMAVLVAAVTGIVGYRTYAFSAPPLLASVTPPDISTYAVDAEAAAARLGAAIRIRTVSIVNEGDDPAPFAQLHAWMQQTYPAFHAAARRELVNTLSLLYVWEGSDPAQPPMLLLAHQDVVPVPDETRGAWSDDPFGGVVRDGAVWGRGAIDDKGSLVAILEAAELLAAQGRRPTRTILFAFGHDEEIGGEGAQAMAQVLADRGVRAWFAIDEGLAIIDRHPLTGRPTALIGIAEKGFATLRVSAVGRPGHSSMPPPETAVSLVAEAVDRVHSMRIERQLGGGPAHAMMRALAPELSLTTRAAVANEWLFGPALQQRFAQDPAAMALIGTTVAPTMMNAGVRPNVLPGEATAMINFRLHPRDTAADILARARAGIADIEGVTLDWAEPPREASATSSVTSSSYALIAALSEASYGEAAVAPGLVLGGTDSRHYGSVAENVYRFAPMVLSSDDLETIHGNNERVSVENLERLIRFYAGLMEAGAMQ